jgi:cation diffusion facilitator family transporter
MSDVISRTVVLAFVANVVVAIAKSIAAVVTGSAAMGAEAVHSWSDAGNEVFLVLADWRAARPADDAHPLGYGREAWVWSLFAAIGVFVIGSIVSVAHGISALRSGEEATNYTIAWIVLGIAAVIEGASFVQATGQVRRKANRARRGFGDHLMRTSNATLRAVFFEDGAALIGLAIAATGIGLHQLTGSSTPDAIASILVGVVLAGVAATLVNGNRRFLVGEVADPDVRRRIEQRIVAAPEVNRVDFLRVEFIGPEEVFVIAGVDIAGNEPEHTVAVALDRAARFVEQEPLVRRVVLTLSRTTS